MTTSAIRDFLTKQLSIDKNIVTFRSLSRQFSLDVHVAHNELAVFLQSDTQSVFATYLVSGERQPLAYRLEQDVIMEEDDMFDDDFEGDDAPQTASVLVAEADLERTQAGFQIVESVLVYSLSPSLPRARYPSSHDSGLLCTPTPDLRETDAKKDAEFGKAVGKIVSAQVVKSNKPLPNWGGRKAPPPAAGPSKPTVKEEKKETKPEKPKPTGKLDFSKAKVKDKEDVKPSKPETKQKASSSKPTISEKVQTKVEESKKTGMKRKSALASDSEEDVQVVEKPKPTVKAESSVRIRKGVILSDDEDDEPPQPDRKGKSKAVSQQEKDLHALMDIDDDVVTRVSRNTTSEPEGNTAADEDIEMSDVEPKRVAAAKQQRKPKKVVPVGKNGLKKKRVVKSKSRMDDKGYMVTEDYSEYESVDEEEAPPLPKAKTKAKEPPAAKAKPAANPVPAKPKPKPSGSSKGPQKSGSIANFFNKK
ncbi:DNA polymerase subunit Cdc27 [Mycena amicta]|nr:DNA polymerase subunit Cdc27 [Mycena amicta]